MALGLPLNFCTGIIEFDLLSHPLLIVTNKPRVTVAAGREKLGWAKCDQKAYRSSLRSPGLSWSSQIESKLPM